MKIKKDKKRIYIILSYTGTFLSRIIKGYTRKEFAHVSIALDKELNSMYSFGRLKPYNPFLAGFVHEGINFGTFKRFKNTCVEVYSLELTNKQYEIISSCINEMVDSSEIYKFNLIGLFGAGFNIKYKRDHSFYCAEFVKYLIDLAEIDLELPELVKPMDFKDNDKVRLEYRGLLRQYKVS